MLNVALSTIMAMLLIISAVNLEAEENDSNTDEIGITTENDTTVGRVMDRAEDVKPLKTSMKAPDVQLKTIAGEAISLHDILAQAPSVLIFYRGGWCPLCMRHMAELAMIKERLVADGFQIVAISPDTPEYISKDTTEGKIDPDILLFSDSPATAAKAFGLAFHVGEPTIEKYRAYDIDLDDRSGMSHHILPVPAAYLVDQEFNILFSYWNPDYKQRVDKDRLLEAATESMETERKTDSDE